MMLLRQWADIFAWDVDDLIGISPMIICHSLNVDHEFKPIHQARRHKSKEQWAVAAEEVEKLLTAGCVEKVVYPKWVSNVFMVRKANDKWRMCIDNTNLNRAYPKNTFPLPKIDRLVDSCAGESHMSFLDAYSSYHQIRMNSYDKECTTFCTNKSLYQFIVMPFGLKNAGATFQCLVNFIFHGMIGESVEAYMVDMLVKGSSFQVHLANLELVF